MEKFSPPPSPDIRTYVPGRRAADPQRQWFVVVWILWAGIGIVALLILAASLPVYAALLQTICISSVCPNEQLTPVTVHELYVVGLSVSNYATWRLVFSIIWMLVWFAVATLLVWRKRNEWYTLLVALMCMLLGTISVTNTVAQSLSPWRWPAVLVNFLGFFLLFLVILLFPDGRFIPRWTRSLVAVFLLQSVCYNFFPTVTFQLTFWTPVLGDLVWIGLILALIASQIYRYRYVSDAVQRQQTKWVFFGFVVVGLAEMGTTLLLLFFPSLGQPGSFFSLLGFGSDYSFILLFIPLTFGIAILRYRLWDIDIIINRTLVYGTLTTCVVALYVLVVLGLGALLQTRGNLLISLLATGLVAVLFQPLRERLQRAVNRLMYGERDTPYRVISRLGQRLEATLAPDEVLPTIVETVAQALKLPYAAITLKQEGELVTAASYGVPKESLTHLPLVYHSEQLGELVLAPRASGETFTPADRALLDDLARQTGVAAHAVRLTSDLQRLAADVQRSREHLVTAREEERRRLRRDLHDGLGPSLATITVKAEAARDAIAAEPAQAVLLLEELIGQAQTAITDIRRLVYNLRPPALDDLGLVAAIRAQAMHYEHPGLRVSIEAPQHLPELSAAVEVAAYRIVQEALTNVVRHANARSCLIRLTFDGALHLEVTDDGCGIPADRQAGVGLRSMQERAVEVGGSCAVEALPSKGTVVQASLPCASDEMQSLQEPA